MKPLQKGRPWLDDAIAPDDQLMRHEGLPFGTERNTQKTAEAACAADLKCKVQWL